MAGAVTQHARWQLAQYESIASDAAADVERLTAQLGAATERYAGCEDGSTWAAVGVAKENLEKAKARKEGADSILERAQAKMRDPAHVALLEKCDELEAAAASSDFGERFTSDLGPRIEEAARALAALIHEVIELVGSSAEPNRLLVETATNLGMRELFANRPVFDQGSGHAKFRDAVARGMKAAGVREDLIRACTGFRL
jgi:hypothetical protein